MDVVAARDVLAFFLLFWSTRFWAVDWPMGVTVMWLGRFLADSLFSWLDSSRGWLYFFFDFLTCAFFWKFFFFYVFESPNFFVIVNVLIQWSVSLHRSYLVYQSGRIGKTACLPQFQQNSNRSHPPAYVLNKFCNLFRKNEQQTFIFSKKLETHSRYHESVQNRSFVHLFRKNRFLTKNAVFLR